MLAENKYPYQCSVEYGCQHVVRAAFTSKDSSTIRTRLPPDVIRPLRSYSVHDSFTFVLSYPDDVSGYTSHFNIRCKWGQKSGCLGFSCSFKNCLTFNFIEV